MEYRLARDVCVLVKTAQYRLLCKPGVVSKLLTCFCASAAINCCENKVYNLRRHAPLSNPGCTKLSTLCAIFYLHRMSTEEIRLELLDVFNSYRQVSTSGFNEERFLEFLVYPPRPVKTSFLRARAYYRFMDALELRFGICFLTKDLDKSYSVESLVRKISEGMSKRNYAMKVIAKRKKENSEIYFESSVVSIVLGIYYFFGVNLITNIAAFLGLIILVWTISQRIYNRGHLRKLEQVISSGAK